MRCSNHKIYVCSTIWQVFMCCLFDWIFRPFMWALVYANNEHIHIYSGWLLVASDWIDSGVLCANFLILLHLKSGIKNQKYTHLILHNFSMGAHMLRSFVFSQEKNKNLRGTFSFDSNIVCLFVLRFKFVSQ